MLLSILTIACQTDDKKAVSTEKITAENLQTQQSTSTRQEGKELLKQYCLSCHWETPDPSKKDKMIAPPIARVIDHYKGTYTDKKDFVNAIVNWVTQPNQDDILMPGAARKFGLMPALAVEKDKLEKIAGYLFNADFDMGHFGHKSKENMHQINKEKAALEKEDFKQIHQAISLLQNTDIENTEAYRQTGKKVFSAAKNLLLNKKYKGETLQQIQAFFHRIEGDMHHLMSVKTKDEGEKYRKIVLKKLQDFDKFFIPKE